MAFSGPSDDRDDDFAPLSSEINVTPFIDVMLVLLIIFMVTAPMLTQGMKVELPTARAATNLENRKPVSITIAADGTLQVQDAAVPLQQIAPAVRAAMAGETLMIQIRADQAASYGAVAGVLDALYADGITKFALVTTPSPKP
jgi:biopolymer transport protein TolR